MRKVNGWLSPAEKPSGQLLDLAALLAKLIESRNASSNSNTIRDGTLVALCLFSLGEAMSTISTSEEPGARLQEALISWATHLAPAEIQDRRYQAAFEAIDRALVATIRYMEDRRAGKPQDQTHECQLTELWMEASRALSPIDDPEVAKVADACIVKGLAWTDPTVWEAAERKGLKIGVQDMQAARMLLNRKRGISVSNLRAQAWFPIAAVCVAAVTVLFLMWPGTRTSEEE